MEDALIQIVWVAAYHGLRKRWRELPAGSWNMLYDLSHRLGYPPVPGGP